MKKFILLSSCCLFLATPSFAETATPNQSLCLFADTPSVEFKTIKRIKVAKGSYGSVTELYPRLHTLADKHKANAIINYSASQRFGFWPWRITRPVGLGTAVKIEQPFNCTSLGGTNI